MAVHISLPRMTPSTLDSQGLPSEVRCPAELAAGLHADDLDPQAGTPPDALGLIDVGTINQGHLGSSSSAWFSNQLRGLVRQHSPHVEGHKMWRTTKLSDLDPNRNSQSAEYGFSASSLPPREMCDSLISHFFSRTFYGIPVIDPLAFRASHEALWAGEDLGTDPMMFQCLLFMVFALASQDNADKSHTERLEDGLDYFNRARDLLRFDIFSGFVRAECLG